MANLGYSQEGYIATAHGGTTPATFEPPKFLSNIFGVMDNSDNTKIARFNLTGFTTGTTRSFILPDYNAQLATVGGTEILLNKTLTAPVINSPTGIVKADVGLGNVDNVSDANKPVSTLQQAALDLKANLADPTFSGNPTAPTQPDGNNSLRIANTQFVTTAVAAAIANLIGTAPAALDTLGELADALADDASFASTITTVLAGKASLAGATFAGDVNVPDEVYDATAWNGSLEVPTKNAIRDKFESLSGATPGGSGAELQYRSGASTFGAVSGVTSDGTNLTAGAGNLRATSPQFTTNIRDVNGYPIIGFTATPGTITNYVNVTNNISGSAPIISVAGGDSNISTSYVAKGTGSHNFTNGTGKVVYITGTPSGQYMESASLVVVNTCQNNNSPVPAAFFQQTKSSSSGAGYGVGAIGYGSSNTAGAHVIGLEGIAYGGNQTTNNTIGVLGVAFRGNSSCTTFSAGMVGVSRPGASGSAHGGVFALHTTAQYDSGFYSPDPAAYGCGVNSSLGVHCYEDNIGEVIKLNSAQTLDAFQIRDSSGNILTRFNKAGYFITSKIAAPADGDLSASQLAIWFDSTNGAAKAKFKGKTVDGTVVTGEVALA